MKSTTVQKLAKRIVNPLLSKVFEVIFITSRYHKGYGSTIESLQHTIPTE